MFGFKKKADKVVDSIKNHEQDMDWVDAQLKSIESGRYTMQLDSKSENQGNFYCLVKALGVIPDLCFYNDIWSITLYRFTDKDDYYINLCCESFTQAYLYYKEIVEDMQNG